MGAGVGGGATVGIWVGIDVGLSVGIGVGGTVPPKDPVVRAVGDVMMVTRPRTTASRVALGVGCGMGVLVGMADARPAHAVVRTISVRMSKSRR